MQATLHRATVWGGALLCGLAVLALTVPVVRYARAVSTDRMVLTSGHMELRLPSHRKYGIYVDDTDNSGYSVSCSIYDLQGPQVDLSDPDWSTSASETETLDYVFDTGSGRLAVDCSVEDAERVRIGPVATLTGIAVGLALAVVLGALGAFALLRARRAQPELPEPTTPAEPLAPADWYLDPDDLSRWRYWDGQAWTDHVS